MTDKTTTQQSPIQKFIDRLRQLDVELVPTSTKRLNFKSGFALPMAYDLPHGYTVLLADVRGWLLNPNQSNLRPEQTSAGDFTLLPEHEVQKAIEAVLETQKKAVNK